MEQNIEKIKSTPIFFIIGNMRSGSTLLRMLFDAHPNIIIPVECPFIGLLYNKYSKTSNWTPKIINTFINDLFMIRKFDQWNINKENLRENLLKHAGECTYQTICKAVIINYPSIFPKEDIMILGDKNPAYSILFNEFYKIFPEANFIHIIRDYRDQVASSKNVDFVIPFTSSICYQWKKTVEKIEKIKYKIPDRFFTIKYEDLVEAPEIHLQKMCNFLKIPFSTVMTEFHLKKHEFNKEYSLYSLEHHHKSLVNPINKNRIGIWRKELNSNQIKIADLVIGNSGKYYGYKKTYYKFNLLTHFKAFPGIMIMKLKLLNRSLLVKMPTKIRLLFYRIIPYSQRIFHPFKRKKQ